MPGVTVGERILVHLAGYLRFTEAYECPAEMTQDGIAAGLGLSRAHVALELKRLRASGRVEERMAHVVAAKTRRKVYGLTPPGQELARKMREHARATTVVLVDPAGHREMRGEQVLALLRDRGVKEAEGLQRILSGGVIDLTPPPTPLEEPPPRRTFVGREAELGTLQEWLDARVEPIAVVVGVAGIGKSALLAAALASPSRPAYLRRLYAHDDAHGVLASCADFLAREGRRRLKALVSRPAYDPVEALAVLREDLAGFVLAFDDLHACPAAEGLLRSLADDPPAAKVLVASRVQPTFYDRAAIAGRRVLEVPLGGLTSEAASAFLASRRPALEPSEAERVLAAARGHPLSLELFAASGLDVGRVESDRFVLETVLDGLEHVPEALLKAFAVLRRPARSPEALGATVAQIRRLLRRAILQHREDGYLLHDLVKEFYLRRIRPEERRWVHRRAARYWEGRTDALEATHHWIEAGEPATAASLVAVEGEAYAEGPRAGDLEACLLRLPEDLRPLRLLAEAQGFLGRFEDARATWRALADRGTPEERLRARIQLGRIATRLGSYAEARELLEAAAEAAAGTSGLRGEALRALGGVERRLGNLGPAIAHLRASVDLLRDNPREQARGRLDLGAALLAREDLPGARAEFEAAARLVDPTSREGAAVENNLAIVLSREGRPEEAARAFERSADTALRAGEVRFASLALANAADNLVRSDRTDDAEACASRALELATQIRDPVALSTARANLGLVHARRGDFARAEGHLLESLTHLGRLDNPYSLATRYAEIAGVVEAQGRTSEAATWRTRAESLYARMRGGSDAPGLSDGVRQASDKSIK